LERVAQPLIGGIYAADPDKLSLGATMPRFKEMEREQRSVILAMWSEQKRRAPSRETGSGARWSLFVTLAGGMQELTNALAKRLPEGSIQLNTPVTNVLRGRNGQGWLVSPKQGNSVEADAIILTTPAFRAGQLLASVAHGAASELKKISYASTAVVNLAYRRAEFPRQPDSFGFVAPIIERRKIMACTFSSLKYPGRAPEDHLLLRAFVGGALQPDLFQDDDATMEENVRRELATLLGVTGRPIFSRIWRHPNSMPQYHMGHLARIKRTEEALSVFPTLALAGSAYHGVGISDCVRTGEEAAEKIMNYLNSNP
jgi:oxygen-dependent protoporphyrinogen oxidase